MDFGAIRSFPPTLPSSRRLFFRRYKWAAVNGRDGDVFPEYDLRADLQEVKLFVRDKPFIVSLLSDREHQIDCTLPDRMGRG